MTIDTTYRLHESLGFQLTITSRFQEHHLEEQLKTLGLTRITWCILLAVENEKMENPSDIANFVGIDRTAASRALRQMENDGMIRRIGGNSDKRKTTVCLTTLGQILVTKATPMAQTTASNYKKKLSEGEFATLRALLAKLLEGEDTALKSL